MRVALIYRAAGNSRRFGESIRILKEKKHLIPENLPENKLLFSIEGKPMYLHLLERLVKICNHHASWEVLVVTQYEEILEMAKSLGVRAVFSPDSQKGASWSVKTAIRGTQDADACAFFVADQPYLSEKTAENFLIDMQKRCQDGLGCVCCEEMTGNPVWFSKKFFPELLKLEGDRGGKKVLKEHWSEVEFFHIKDRNELQDVDVWTME